jgi:hypothetical protein
MHWEGCSVERTTSDDGDSDTSDDAYTMAIIARMQSIGTFIYEDEYGRKFMS